MSTVSTVSTVITRCYLHLRWYFFPSSQFPSFAWYCCCWACANVMWGFSCAQGIKWRWNVYFGSSLLLWSNSFSLYSLPFYILNLLLFSISYHHNYYGHMSCLFYTKLILFTALLLRLFVDLSCQISLMPSTLSLPQAQGGMVSGKTLSFVRPTNDKNMKIKYLI